MPDVPITVASGESFWALKLRGLCVPISIALPQIFVFPLVSRWSSDMRSNGKNESRG